MTEESVSMSLHSGATVRFGSSGIGLSVGVGLGSGVGLGVGLGLRLGVGLGLGAGLDVGVGLGVGLRLRLGAGLDIDVGLGLGVGLGLSVSNEPSSFPNSGIGVAVKILDRFACSSPCKRDLYAKIPTPENNINIPSIIPILRHTKFPVLFSLLSSFSISSTV